MTSVLIIGTDPSTVDPDDPSVPAGVTPETIARGIEEALKDMRGRGWHASHCAIMPDGSAEATIAGCLKEAPWDVIVIGGGIRTPPQYLELFERVIAAIREGAPDAAIAFNTKPEDSGEAALRWLGPRDVAADGRGRA